MVNTNLSMAKVVRNDEFYTQLPDIENELRHYKDHFKGKIIFCNCDDPTWSNFWRYFHLNFTALGLKKLISTHFDRVKSTYKMEYMGGNDADVEAGTKILLEGNGDFESAECTELLKEADIVVTNPPFSLFREYVAVLMEHNKKFIIIGNMNAITYKDFFPLIKAGKVWGGYGFNKTFEFIMPDNYELKGKAYIDSDGKKHGFVPAITWFTNLDIQKRHEPFICYKMYAGHESDYPKYDNYDVIGINRITDIPIDYKGVMGVPISGVSVLCPEQFDIVWQACGNSYQNAPKDILDKLKFNSAIKYGGGLGTPVLNGKATYARILIKYTDTWIASHPNNF